jgi:hypothetical protein
MSQQQSLIEPQVLPPADLHLTIPNEVSALASGTDRFIVQANEFEVDSEPAFQVADEVQARLKAEAKQINDKRMEFTRPIDAIKAQWMNFFKPAVDSRQEAATIYQRKMSAYRTVQRQKAEAAQREAEQLLREEREKKEAEARRLEEKASKLKTAAARERAEQEAAEIRQVAAMMPESVALSASAPATVASNVAEIWEVEAVVDTSAYLRWLADHPEWHTVFVFKDAEHKRLAKQFHSIGVPGLKFCQRDSFRTKSGRR